MAPAEQFEIAAAAVSAKIVHSSPEEADHVVGALLRSLGVSRIISDSRKVRLADFERSTPDSADCGVTDAEWGIASTGSLVLPITVDRHRATSLLPPTSIVLLDEERILPDLPSALGFIGDTYVKGVSRPSSVILVTGPSRTADIELSLVTGVHGPKELIVVLVH